MKGFDTNLLVRYLVRDDPQQSAIVERLVAEVVDADEFVFLNHIVLCETFWVLESGYGYEREAVAEALEKLLLTQQFDFEGRDLVWSALRRFRAGKADLADYLIGETNLSNGCERTLTFDRGLKEEKGFELLG